MSWGLKLWKFMSPGTVRVFAWYEIISLTFRFFFSEFYMFNRTQFEALVKWHRLAMFVVIALLAGVLVGTLVEAQNDRARITQELDKQDGRIKRLDDEMKEVRISVGILTDRTALILWLLAGIAAIMLGQLTVQVWKMKAGAAINHIIDQEFDRRKRKRQHYEVDEDESMDL